MRTIRTIIAASIVAALPAIASAQMQSPERPLPRFTLAGAGGTTTSSTTLAAGGRAVLVIVKPSCQPCKQLLDEIARIDDPAIASRLVLVVAAPFDEASAFAHRLPPQLATARWFADAERSAWTALEVKGLPKVFGIEGQKIGWTHSGVPHRGLLEPLMRTWLGSAEVSK